MSQEPEEAHVPQVHHVEQTETNPVVAAASNSPPVSVSNQHALPRKIAALPQDERLARLRALRSQREQQGGRGSVPPAFQRRGVPRPPLAQRPFREAVKHWWEHGPFAERGAAQRPDEDVRQHSSTATPGPAGRITQASSTLEKSQHNQWLLPRQSESNWSANHWQLSPGIPGRQNGSRFVDARASALAGKGRKALTLLSTYTQNAWRQAKTWLARMIAHAPEHAAQVEEQASGLILVGFAADVARQDAVALITALGGKPVRYQAPSHLFQVAVPPRQEGAFIALYRQQPGVVLAGLPRPEAG